MLQHCHILGIPQCVAETTNLAMCSVELKQILHSIIRPHNVMSTQQVIELMSLGALRNCKLIQLNGSAARQANEIANPLSDPNLSVVDPSHPQALYTALHRLKEVVLITDDLLRIQYANRATERLLNMRLVSGNVGSGSGDCFPLRH